MQWSWTVLLEALGGLAMCVYYTFVDLFKWAFPASFFKSVDGDLVLVTGGGSGIGRLMAVKLARLGATVVTVDMSERGNEETIRIIKKETGGAAFGYTCDLSVRAEVYAMAQKVKRERGVVTMLVNNAGIVSGNTLLDTPDEKIEKTFQVNTLAHFWTVKAFLPDMIAQKKGHVVNIASLAGHNGISRLVDYCSSKFAAVGFDEALREELGALGHSDYVKTTVVCPFYINTGMFDGVQSKFIDILDPDFVVERAVEGILTDSEVVIVPRWVTVLMLLKAMVPARGYGLLANAIGVNQSMDHFTGRKGEPKKAR